MPIHQEKNKDSKDKTAREMAVETVYQILEKEAFSNLTLEKNLSSADLKPEDKKLVTEIVNGTVRMRLRLDWTLSHFLKKGIEKLNPWMRSILRTASYQILFMERIPDHAAVSEAVILTRSRVSEGLTGLCNGVLRSLLRQKSEIDSWLMEIDNPVKRDAVRYSMPDFMVKQIHKDYKYLSEDEKTIIFEHFNTPGTLELRANQMKNSAEELVQILKKEKIQARSLNLVPEAVEIVEAQQTLTVKKSFQEGRFYIQNSASQLAAHILAPKSGDIVLDLCCGIGGKSTHLAEITQDKASITAVERYAHKLQLLLENCERLGLHSVHPLCADITQGLPEWQEKADCVVADLPCSGWGVLNRRADIRWGQSRQQLRDLEALQKNLLVRAAELVKKGGVLLYSTCTIRPQENEQTITEFLEKNPAFHLENFADEISFFPLSASDRKMAGKGMLTILPGIYGTDGMFYAKLRKGGI